MAHLCEEWKSLIKFRPKCSDKKEYSYGLPGTDKHKYGYEINENSKYFHHTTTADDGVRSVEIDLVAN